jgi:NADH:ubiquinone oxidoreductase subunit F (NADH-binding)/(2Fe-2S) ferredoxin
MSAAASALDRLRQAANGRRDPVRGDKTRFVVQMGHCSLAVGAADVADAITSSLPDEAYIATAGCDGACFDAPCVVVTDPSGGTRRYVHVTAESARKIAGGGHAESEEGAFFDGQHRLSLDGCGELDSTNIDDYILDGGYAGTERTLSMSPEEVIEKVEKSGLRGRGGAYFPAALKWRATRSTDATPRYLVVNCEEGEPGIFKDRHLMEGVPHRILEGAIIAAYASGVSHGYIYINAEAELSSERMEQAVRQAHDSGLLGDDILGTGFSLSMEIRRGAGGYVCGEETTLLNTMEGYRREPRLRPPFPTEAGLLGKPTTINNAETLASIPFIMSNGAEAFAEIGSGDATGTKLMSLSGSVKRPGVAEVPLGTTLRQILYDIGGGPTDGHSLKALAVGGPSSGVLPPSMLDTPIAPGLLHESGVMLGAGGVIALDERMSVPEVVRSLAAYNANESCGKCTPCREGTPRIVELLDRLASPDGSPTDLNDLRFLARVVNSASLCGLGQAAGNPITSALHFFPDEF